ncbi:hypothetical protein CLOM_g14724 [Closterium sp. NIES-68]|nr:hypothetical protein CLOM_g14724 [Closterium sp. NIES-68]GJP81758.1 hypothetical protein CLOP_g11890 [Closterium sp. NIES-67]
MASSSKAYLAAYNLAQATGWAVALAAMLHSAATTASIAGAFHVAWPLVYACQFASILETVHAATGLVRSGVAAPLVQWVGRSFVLFAVVGRTPALHAHAALFVLLAVWCCSEVIRYPQYALSLLGTCPAALTWLRYSAFIPLYPIGMFGGEMVLIYLSLPFVKAEQPLAFVFNRLPFDYYHVLMVILAAYPLFWLHLYTHMFRQRRAKLFPKSRAGGKKAHKAVAIVPLSPDMFAETTADRPAPAAAAAAVASKDGGALPSISHFHSSGATRLRPAAAAAAGRS